MQKELLPMNLQLFAKDGEVTAEPNNDNADNQVKTEETEDTKAFTQDDVNNIVKGRVDRATRDLTKQIEDLKEQLDTQGLSPKDKKSYEEQKREKELEDLRLENLNYKLSKIATKALTDKGYVPTEDILNVVVGIDEDATLEKIDAVTNLVDKLVNERVKEKAREVTPINGDNSIDGKDGFNVADFANKNRRI